MKILMVALAVLGSATSLYMYAEQASQPVPLDLEAEFYRADGLVAHMKPEWEAANRDLDQAGAELKKFCGEAKPAKSGKHLVCVP